MATCAFFVSPLSDRREDRYGGSFDNRVNSRSRWRARCAGVAPDKPVFYRVSATDWYGGWDLDRR